MREGNSNKKLYEEFCRQRETIPLYLQPFWLDAVCTPDKWDALIYLEEGEVVAVFPYYIKKVAWLKYITMPDFVQYMGCWIDYPKDIRYERERLDLEKKIMSYFIEELEKLDVCFFRQSFGPHITNWLPFYWKGYTQTTRYTYCIKNVSELEKVVQDFRKDKKRDLKKALKEDYTVRYDMPAEEFYELHRNSLEEYNGKYDPIDYSFDTFKRMYDAAYENNAGRTLCIENKKGEAVCALFSVWDNECAYALIKALRPEGRKNGMRELGLYRMLEFLGGKVKKYDFEGSMIEGVENSLHGFGTTQVPYFSIRKIYTKNPLIRFLIWLKMR